MTTTIEQTITNEMQKDGYTLHGTTSGWMTTRRGSNLNRYLVNNNLLDAYLVDKKLVSDGLLDDNQRRVVIRCGAKRRHQTEGTNLHVYTKQA